MDGMLKVSTSLLISFDRLDDEACLSVITPTGRKLEMINTFTGENAINLFKVLKGDI